MGTDVGKLIVKMFQNQILVRVHDIEDLTVLSSKRKAKTAYIFMSESVGFRQIKDVSLAEDSTLLLKTSNPNQVLNSLELNLDSQVYTYETDGNTTTVKEVYRPGKSADGIIQIVGVWNKDTGLIWTKAGIWERRENLHGIELHCATEHVRNACIKSVYNLLIMFTY